MIPHLKKTTFPFVICFLFSIHGFAAEPSIEVQVDRDTITQEETLNLSIIIKGGSALTTPDIPSSGNFDVVGRSSGSAIEIINGVMSVTKTFEYQLAPRKPGEFKIGPIKAHIEGRTYAAGPIRIRVLKSERRKTYIPPPQVSEPMQPPQIPTMPTPSWPLPGQAGPQNIQARGPTFVTAEVDKHEAYVGEQVLFILRFYSAVSVQNAQLSLPDFKDFITEELIKERKYKIQLDGREYAVNEWRLALLPTKAGNLKTGKSVVKGRVSVPRRGSLYDDPFFRGFGTNIGSKKLTFSAPSLSIEVKKLPPPPSGFIGLVGEFTLESKLSKTQLSLGDTTNLDIEISGKGNIGEAHIPPLKDNPYFKIYPAKPIVKMENSLSGIEGKKIFSFAMVAERPGKGNISSLEFHYFDPQDGSYKELVSPNYSVSIMGGASNEKLVTAGLKTSKTFFTPREKIFDLQPIKPANVIISTQVMSPIEKILWTGILIIPALLFVLYLIWERQKARALAQAGDRKASKAFRRLKTSLNKVDLKSFPEDLSQWTEIMKAYLSDRFQIQRGALTPIEVEEFLKSKGVSAEIIRKTIYLLEQLDAWKYGGMRDTLPNEKVLKQEIIEVFRQIEKAA